MAQFHVTSTFEFPDRNLFVLAGSIVEGEVKAGMFVQIPVNSSLAITAQILCIELALQRSGLEDVCLCLRADATETEMLRALNINDETFEIKPESGQ